MSDKKNKIISAQVIMYTANGEVIDYQKTITAENIINFVPDPKMVSSVSNIFRTNGFDTGPVVGISFSITAKVSTFEKFLHVLIQPHKDGGFEFMDKRRELTGEKLPKVLQNYVQAIVFPRPIDFGPKEW
jgi:subtilase family serine protease